MKKTACPGCGAGYNGRRCRNCGYENFSGITTGWKPSPAASAPRKEQQKHPLIRFLILLYLIYLLMPIFRQWGLKLEAMEDAVQNSSSYHTEEVPHG